MKSIQDLFRKSKQEWLQEAREVARNLSHGNRIVTIEDVLAICPLPKYLHHNTIGSVFSQKDFKRVGYTSSRRTISHGRVITQWISKGEFGLPDDWAKIKQQASDGDYSRVSVVD